MRTVITRSGKPRTRNSTDIRLNRYQSHSEQSRPLGTLVIKGLPDNRGQAAVYGWPGGHSEGLNTRSHPELGSETPPRRWYCVLRRGRVGRRQAFHKQRATGNRGNCPERNHRTHTSEQHSTNDPKTLPRGGAVW